ncbi:MULTISPECIES: hypothetical protein [unclassified Stenotrophomonas]|uniref:hypothetical protein n=1 Tax=unclassified Stenotrophomonas TaxID=196198 RepID=UPI003012A03A
MNTADELRGAFEAGYHMRDMHKSREKPPLFEMGEDGRARQKQWQAGWDKRDGEIKRKAA